MKRTRKKRITALSKQSEDPLWQLLDSKIGGRKGLLEMALTSASPKAAIVAELCLDKAFSRSGTKDLARKAGLTADEIVDMYRNKKWLEATMALHEQLPEIIGGAAEDAKPQYVPCSECKASGHAENGDTCWVCGGAKEIRKGGDKDKLRFVGEAAGLVGKLPPQNQINNQINIGVASQSVSFEDLVRKATVNVNKPRQIEAPEAEIVEK